MDDVTIPPSRVIPYIPMFSSIVEERVLIGSAQIPTGIAFEIPVGYWGEVKSRSGLGFKHGIEVGAGTIDAGFRGGVSVKLYNHTHEPYHIKRGERIAQIVFQKCELWEPVEVGELSEAERGTKGFGDSGK
jgi:dUTP pyrophosphatase